MRIARIQAFIAVLGLAAVFHPVKSYEHTNETLHGIRTKRSSRKHGHNSQNPDEWDRYYNHSDWIGHFDSGKLKWLSPRENQLLIKHETQDRKSQEAECCPSVLEMISPIAGANKNGELVELYNDGGNKQKFFELSCHKDILDKPCRFMDRKLHEQSKCVQKYSYSYALIKDPGRHHHRPDNFHSFPSGGSPWTLDYIKVRSGCSCVITPKGKTKRKHRRINRDGNR